MWQPFQMRGTHMNFPFKTLIWDHCTHLALTPIQNANLIISRPSVLVYFQDHGKWTTNFAATKVWLAEDLQQAFDKWKGQITLVLCASSINRDIWYTTIIGYLSKEGFKCWNTLPISTDEEAQKDPEKVFQAKADTLEVSTSYWNHIDEIYSDIK